MIILIKKKELGKFSKNNDINHLYIINFSSNIIREKN